MAIAPQEDKLWQSINRRLSYRVCPLNKSIRPKIHKRANHQGTKGTKTVKDNYNDTKRTTSCNSESRRARRVGRGPFELFSWRSWCLCGKQSFFIAC
ncbi:MAG: hypothetical protein WD063_12780 [Pirellulales bacterium]